MLILLALSLSMIGQTVSAQNYGEEPGFFTMENFGGAVVQRRNWQFTDPGGVVYHDGMFHMLQNSFHAWPDRVSVYYSVSEDGISWERAADTIVFTVDDVPYADLSALVSSLLVEDDGTWVMYYYTLNDDDTPMTAIAGQFDIGDQRARGALAGAGVSIRMQDTKIGALSGGQKARLAMLALRLKHPNFYLLDEPTNHLDIEGQEALEDELITHGATCLLVSHDRSFLRNVGNRFWWIRGNKLEEVDSPEPFLAEQMNI